MQTIIEPKDLQLVQGLVDRVFRIESPRLAHNTAPDGGEKRYFLLIGGKIVATGATLEAAVVGTRCFGGVEQMMTYRKPGTLGRIIATGVYVNEDSGNIGFSQVHPAEFSFNDGRRALEALAAVVIVAAIWNRLLALTEETAWSKAEIAALCTVP